MTIANCLSKISDTSNSINTYDLKPKTVTSNSNINVPSTQNQTSHWIGGPWWGGPYWHFRGPYWRRWWY